MERALMYLIFTILLFVVLVGIVAHYYSPGRKEKVEKPKYKMFDDNDQ